uniref:Uncharacterized protein n=1 Tax=Romanomermis culicivorax TaxID=13658 RepID=A0A915HUW9_ROMCU
MVFLTHYSHNVMSRGLITIYSNGTHLEDMRELYDTLSNQWSP